MTYTTAMILVFVVGYLAITLEHPIKINKTATALVTGILCWTIYILGVETDMEKHHVVEHLTHHLAKTSEILFFLIGAMTIVDLVDAHQGFRIVTDNITTRSSRRLIWLIAIVSFFMSAVLDNLTTSIVMVSLLRKLVKDAELRKFYAGLVVIAANAGGAWTPIGDVTTTMLWIGGQITAFNIMETLLLPSLICLIIPLFAVSLNVKGELPPIGEKEKMHNPTHSIIMFVAGIIGLIFVPVFKTITHLPPYTGILLSLGLIWMLSEFLDSNKDEEERKHLSVAHALSKIDSSSVLFFMGILLAISSLESTHILSALAKTMNDVIGNEDVIVMSIGIASAIIDNVPLVAACMGMYDLNVYPVDAKIWEFLAYCAGTGGSILIIGSAAGVAVMGMEKIDFFWYVKKISLYALIGYFAGAFAYIGIYYALHH